MRKNSKYLTRAMQASDRRYESVLRKLGHTEAEGEQQSVPVADLTALRAEYQDVLGKRPYHGWDEDELRAKIAEARAE